MANDELRDFFGEGLRETDPDQLLDEVRRNFLVIRDSGPEVYERTRELVRERAMEL